MPGNLSLDSSLADLEYLVRCILLVSVQYVVLLGFHSVYLEQKRYGRSGKNGKIGRSGRSVGPEETGATVDIFKSDLRGAREGPISYWMI